MISSATDATDLDPTDLDPSGTTGASWLAQGTHDDFSKERQPSDSRGEDVTSLRLRYLLNKCMRYWDDKTEEGKGDVNATAEMDLTGTMNSYGKVDVTAVKERAKSDIIEVWNAAAELEKEVVILHEELELSRSYQEEFEDEKAALQAHTRELGEKLQQVQAFWKGRLKGAEHELNETEKRLLQMPTGDNDNIRHSDDERVGSSELEERNSEMYNELLRANEELSRLQTEKANLKNQVTSLKADLRQRAGSADELAQLSKKYEAIKTRATNMQTRLAQSEEDIETMTENLMEAESKNQEYETLLQEQREQQSELTRHLDALRRVNSTLVPDNAMNMSQSYDLFAELQQAQLMGTLNKTADFRPVEKEPQVVPAEVATFVAALEEPQVVQPEVATFVPAPEEPQVVKQPEVATFVATPEGADKIQTTTSTDGTIHIHLHQHFHTHAHKHQHQHDHLHQCGCGRSKKEGHKVIVRQEVAKIYDMIRSGKVIPGDVKFSQRNGTQPAPPGSPSSPETAKAYGGSYATQILPRFTEGTCDVKAVAKAPEDNHEAREEGAGSSPGVKGDVPTKTFTYVASKMKGRTTRHEGFPNENLATIFIDSIKEAETAAEGKAESSVAGEVKT